MSTAFAFPPSPTVGQVVTLPDGNQATWIGYAWVEVPAQNSGGGITDAPADSKMYGRFNTTWARAVALGGDTMTGPLTVPTVITVTPTASPGDARLDLNKKGAAQFAYVRGMKDSSPRWQILLGSSTAESGANAGSDFGIERFDDNGAWLSSALSIIRATGNVTVGTDFNTGTGNIYAGADKSFGMRQNASYPNILFSIDGRRLELSRTGGNFYFVGTSNNILFNFDPSGNFSCAGINATSYNYATHLRSNGNPSDTLMTFQWAGQSGTPNWVFGATDAQFPNIKVYSPAQMTVANATTANGQRFDWSNDSNGPTYVWGADNNGRAYLAWRPGLRVSYADSAGSAPANGGTAQNSNQVSGIGGWAYRNDGNNPAYLWCTEGDGQAQHLTTPWALSVNYAGTAGNANALGGAGTGYWINNASTAVQNIRNNGVVQYFSAVGGYGDIWWPINASDERLKKDIAPTKIDWLSAVMRIELKEFRYRSDVPWKVSENDTEDHPEFVTIDDGRLHPLGVVTQQLLTANEAFVDTEAGEWQQPDKDVLLYAALYSIQKLEARIADLEAQLKGTR